MGIEVGQNLNTVIVVISFIFIKLIICYTGYSFYHWEDELILYVTSILH